MSFGWHRAEVLGAIVSVLMIWVVTGILVYMAVLRVLTQVRFLKKNWLNHCNFHLPTVVELFAIYFFYRIPLIVRGYDTKAILIYL